MAPVKGTRTPDQIYMEIDGLSDEDAYKIAQEAVILCRRNAPKLTGDSAKRITPIWGPGYFGVHWVNARVWYQNTGIHPFVMRSLAGHVIPMWVDDLNGEQAMKNPKAKTRTTASGKRQILIFRRVAQMGQRKIVTKKIAGTTRTYSIPLSYPGSPGRIAMREAGDPNTTKGKVAGQIAKGNIGLRWYHPGLHPRNFLEHGLYQAAESFNLPPGVIRHGFDFYNSRNEEV